MNKFRRSSVLLLSMGLLLSLSVGASAAPAQSSSTLTPLAAPGTSNIVASTQENVNDFVLPANADNLNKEAISSFKSSSQPVATVEYHDETAAASSLKKDGDVTIYGTSVPTSYYNILGNGAYTGSFWTNNSVIYTNYYFTSNSDKKLYLSIQTSKEPSQDTTFGYVYLFSTDKSGYLTRTSVNVAGSSTVTFSNLDANKFYYIGFGVEALNKGYEGDIRVYH